MPDVWTTVSSMSTKRHFLPGNRSGTIDAFAAGGINEVAVVLDTTELYDGGNDSWSSKATMSQAWYSMGACQSSTIDALVFGGATDMASSIADTSFYDGTANNWSAKASLNFGRADLSGCVSGSIDALSFGGATGGSLSDLRTEFYDGTANSWTNKTLSPVRNGRQASSSNGSVSGRILLGQATDFQNHNVLYNPLSDSYSVDANALVPTGRLGGCENNTTDALIFGGDVTGTNQVPNTYHYDAGGDAWSSRSSMNAGRNDLGSSLSGTDGAMAYGGTSSGFVVESAELYAGFSGDGFTRNTIYSTLPIETTKGGTNSASFSNTYGVLAADATGESVTSIDPGTSGQVLQSAGSGSLPSFQTAGTTAPMFQVLSSDPSSPVAGQCWYNSTSDLYKAYDGVGTAIVTFTVT